MLRAAVAVPGGMLARLLALILTLCGLAFPPAAPGASVRVPRDYFGVNYQRVLHHAPALRAKHFAAIRDLGIREVRLDLPWRGLEPSPPDGSSHAYDWTIFDPVVGAAAEAGVRIQLTFGKTPAWARGNSASDSVACRLISASSERPAAWAAPHYGAAFAAIVRRYGRDGTYWANHPGLPNVPIVRYEVWNEPNLAGSWCPAASPELYADFFRQAYESATEEDPEVGLLVGVGNPGPNQTPPSNVGVTEFLARAKARQPGLTGYAEGIAVHAYPSSDPENQLVTLADLRHRVREGGIPDSEPLLVSEIGWNTRGRAAVTEAQRADLYRALTRRTSRTNCNVVGLVGHAWVTNESNPDHYDDWYGIAGPTTATPYPSALAFGDGIALMRGETDAEPPTETIEACAGMPKPDSDGDGTLDEADYFPHDPSRTTPPDDGGGDPGGGGPAAAGCTARLVSLTVRMASAAAGERRALRRRYSRVERRCVPCARKVHRLRRRVAAATGERRAQLRRHLRHVRAGCRPCLRRLRSLQLRALSLQGEDLAALLERHERVRRRCRP